MILDRISLSLQAAPIPGNANARQPTVLVNDFRLGPEHWLDIVALRLSCLESGAHYLFNCSCGEPGCAGIWREVAILHHIPGLVVWRVPRDDISYEGDVPLKTHLYWRGFQFQRDQYVAAIKEFFEPFESDFKVQLNVARCLHSWGFNTPQVALPGIYWLELQRARAALAQLRAEQVSEPKPGW